jgi:hypothetical protein
MSDIFKAEFRRFLSWAAVYALAQTLALLFLTRMVDLAQQPDEVYFVIAAVHAVSGLLLGLFQMGAYRRPNAWLNLLHRPLAHWRVGLALLAAGTLLIAIAVLVPLLATAAWQELMTARVLDQRHIGLCIAAFGIGLIGYLSGAAAMLVPRPTAAAPLAFLALLPAAYATGVGLLALQLLVIAWLLALTLAAFKPDLYCAPRGVAGVLLAAPLQVVMWMLLVLAGFGFELALIAKGTHPSNQASVPTDRVRYADEADAAALMALGLASSAAPDAALWREQAAISDFATLGLDIPVTPVWNEFGNRAPMEFDDEERRIRWVFSHDRRRFVGYHLIDRSLVGELAVDGDLDFPSPPLPGPRGLLIGRDTLHEFDVQTQRVLARLSLPADEVIAGVDARGERLAVLSDRALYLYDARPLSQDQAPLATRQRVPLPDASGNLTRVDIMELLDGHLVSFTMTRHFHNGQGAPFQQITRVDTEGRVETVARRALDPGFDDLFIWRTWWMSPAIDQGLGAMRRLFAPHQPGYVLAQPPRPDRVRALAGVLMLMSLLVAIVHVRRTALGPVGRLAWCASAGLVGLPALMALWLMAPAREDLASAPAPASA